MLVICPHCKKETRAGSRFCMECGEDLAAYPLPQRNPGPPQGSPVAGGRFGGSREGSKRTNHTALPKVIGAGLFIIGVILVIVILAVFVGGMHRDVPISNVTVTGLRAPPSTPLKETVTLTPAPAVPVTPVPKPAVTPETPTPAATRLGISLNAYCAQTYPGTSYNPATRHCEAVTLAPSLPSPTPDTGLLAPSATLSDSSEGIYRDYSWNYKGTGWSWNGIFPRAGYEYYRGRSHTRENNYAEYALSDYDRTILQDIVQKFRDGGIQKGYTRNDNVLNIVSFVQSLPYTSDKVTTGFDEYPRYPLETLIDNGGDCEDTAILTAALLNELGQGVVLVRLPGHMAVGIKGSDDLGGTSYSFRGAKYYYLETTGSGWDIGEIPDEYRNLDAIISPLVQVPMMDIECNSTVVKADEFFIYFHQQCRIENVGVGTARSPKLYFGALALSKGSGLVWGPDQVVTLDDYSEGATGYAEAELRVPPDELTQIKYQIYGDNFLTVEQRTPEFTS